MKDCTALRGPHPGAALLEQHRRELLKARNDALEEAAEVVETLTDRQAVLSLKREEE